MTGPAAEAPVQVGGLSLGSPVMVASGCGGTGAELAAYGDLATLGAFVTRSITLDPREGAAPPRVRETPSGLVNHVGLHNPGVDHFLATELPRLVQAGATVVVSVAGRTVGEYTAVVQRLATAPGVAGIEANLSPPDPVGQEVFEVREPFHAASVVGALARELPAGTPLLAKIRPDVGRAVETVRAVCDAGATGVVIGNALPAVMPDGRAGGLSGPAIGPVVGRSIAEVRTVLGEVDLVACGGLSGPEDARTALASGARALQLGTAVLHDPTAGFRTAAVLAGHDESGAVPVAGQAPAARRERSGR